MRQLVAGHQRQWIDVEDRQQLVVAEAEAVLEQACGGGAQGWQSTRRPQEDLIPGSVVGHNSRGSCDQGAVARLARRSDRQLLAATPGDAEAFGVLFERHHRIVLTYLRRRTTDPEIAADLTAETFAAALVAAHQGSVGHVEDAMPWLVGIARHKLLDSYRRGRTASEIRERLGLAELALRREDLDLIDQIAGMDGALRVSLADLPPDERDAIVSRFLLDHSYDEIATASRTSQLAIRKRVSRGLARLRGELEKT